MSVTPRAATSDELLRLRRHGQSSTLKLFVYTPPTVWSGSIDHVIDADQGNHITWTEGSGDIADVLEGMTCFIGSAAGLHDIGATMVTGISSGNLEVLPLKINWSSATHLTIVDDFEIWARRLAMVDGQWKLDGEVDYASQLTTMSPVPVMGPYFAMLELVNATVSLSPQFSNSWVAGVGTVTYSCSVVGPHAVTVTDPTTNNPTLTFSEPGIYRIALTVTANATSNTGYRYVKVYNAAEPLIDTGFSIGRIAGNTISGGWEFDIQVIDEVVDLSSLYPRSVVVLVADDWYEDGDDTSTKMSIGPIPGYENIVAIGRVSTQSANFSSVDSPVTLTVVGPHLLLESTPSTSAETKDTTSTPTNWTEIFNLTVDKALWYWARWRTSAFRAVDVYRPADTRHLKLAGGNATTLWSQLQSLSRKIGASPACDRYGRIFVAVDPQIVPVADRSSIPVIMTVGEEDVSNSTSLTWQMQGRVSQLTIGGFADVDGQWVGMRSKSLLNPSFGSGSVMDVTDLAFTSQDQANSMCGLIFARENAFFSQIALRLMGNNRLVDITPNQYLSVDAGVISSSASLEFAGSRVIPRRVELNYDPKTTSFTTMINADIETSGPSGVTIIPPVPGKINIIGGGRNRPNLTFPWRPYVFRPPIVTPPPMIPPRVTAPSDGCMEMGAPTNGPWDTWIRGTRTNNIAPTYGLLDCLVRAATSTNGSTYRLQGKFYGRATADDPWVETTDDDFYSISALGVSGSSEIIGIKDPLGENPSFRTGSLSPSVGTEIYAVKLSFGTSGTVDIASSPSYYLQPAQVGLGTIGVILYEELTNVVLSPTLYSVLNATFTTGGYSAYGNKYHVVLMDIVFETGSSGSYNVRVRGAEFSSEKFLGTQLVYQNGDYYGSPEIPITPIITDVDAVEGGFTFTFTDWPAGRVLRVRQWLSWLNGDDHTIVYRMDVWVEPVPTRRIDVESLVLYNVCPTE